MKRIFLLIAAMMLIGESMMAAEYLPLVRPNVTWYYINHIEESTGFKLFTPFTAVNYTDATGPAGEVQFELRQDVTPLVQGDMFPYPLVDETNTMSPYYGCVRFVKGMSVDTKVLYNFTGKATEGVTEFENLYPGHAYQGKTVATVDGVARNCFLYEGGKIVEGIGFDGWYGTITSPFGTLMKIGLSHVVENGKVIYRGEAFEDVARLVRQGVVWTFRVQHHDDESVTESMYDEFFKGERKIGDVTYTCLYRIAHDEAMTALSTDLSSVEPRAFVRQDGAKVYSLLNPNYVSQTFDENIATYEADYYTQLASEQGVSSGEVLIYDFDDVMSPYENSGLAPSYGIDESTDVYAGIARRVRTLNFYDPSVDLPKCQLIEGIGINSYDHGDLISPFLVSPTSVNHDVVGLYSMSEYGDVHEGAAQWKYSGVNDVKVNRAADARYYDLQGRPVSNPTAGTLYIHEGKVVRY